MAGLASSFLTDLDGTAADVDAFHRRHAEVELAIRDLKEGAGMEHVPSGNFSANGAWLCCAVLAHNLLRWSVTLGRRSPIDELVVARTVRTRLIAIPARLVNLAGTPREVVAAFAGQQTRRVTLDLGELSRAPGRLPRRAAGRPLLKGKPLGSSVLPFQGDSVGR